MLRRSLRAWIAILLLSATGCTAIQDHVVDCETKTRNCILAEKAWMHWASCYGSVDYKLHFAKGFKDGYRDVLAGGKGCQPTLPPRWYWKPCYQTPEGRCKIAAWFDGFSHGAVAAQQDGHGSLQQLPISPTARANWLSRQTPQSAACFSGMSLPESTPSDSPAAEEEYPQSQVPASPLQMEDNIESGESPIDPVRPYDDSTSP